MPGGDGVMAPEFSRPARVSRLADSAEYRIAATDSECAALARRFGLIGIERLAAEVTLARVPGGIRLDAALDATVVQECVVTLEPVRATLSERFAILYAKSPDTNVGNIADLDDADIDEAVTETLSGNEIDIGEAVAQQLSLALDPFPRAPGATLAEADGTPVLADHPFGILSERRS